MHPHPGSSTGAPELVSRLGAGGQAQRRQDLGPDVASGPGSRCRPGPRCPFHQGGCDHHPGGGLDRGGRGPAGQRGVARLSAGYGRAAGRRVKQQHAFWTQRRREVQDKLGALEHQLAADPGHRRLQADREASVQELNDLAAQQEMVRRFTSMSGVEVRQEQAALPSKEPVQPRPLPAAAIGGPLGLAVGAGLAWWHSRHSGTLTIVAAGGR